MKKLPLLGFKTYFKPHFAHICFVKERFKVGLIIVFQFFHEALIKSLQYLNLQIFTCNRFGNLQSLKFRTFHRIESHSYVIAKVRSFHSQTERQIPSQSLDGPVLTLTYVFYEMGKTQVLKKPLLKSVW